MSIIVNEDQRDLLKNINAPTLLIWGENDTATPIRRCKNNMRGGLSPGKHINDLVVKGTPFIL